MSVDDWLPKTPWFPVQAPLTGGTSNRSAELLATIAAQFSVRTAQRYQPAGRDTYCNVYACDLTAALGCGLPRVWPVGIKLADGSNSVAWKERSANDLYDWLVGPHAKRFGWESVNEHVASRAADEGQVALAAWRNFHGGHGHIAVLLPSFGAMGTFITQAGQECFDRTLLGTGFGNLRPSFFFHP